jgi:hypothetical protein
MSRKNDSRSGVRASVEREPNMTSFERALVKATFMRRQSFTRSPIFARYLLAQRPKDETIKRTVPSSFERTIEMMMQSLSLP